MKRIAFFGSDEIALPALERIVTEQLAEIAFVFSQPDRPSGRGRRVEPNAIVAWARSQNIPVFQPEKPGCETAGALREFGCEAVLVMACGHILKPELLTVPPLGFYNLHASLLPALRGATPIEGAIVSGLAETGVTLQRVAVRLDAGDVVDVERVALAPDETRLTLREKIAGASAPLISRALPRILAGEVNATPQDESRASYTRKITREDSAADFNASARELAARVRAFSPWPGVTVPFVPAGGGAGGGAGAEVVLKIGGAVAEEVGAGAGAGVIAGTVLSADAGGIRVVTGAGVLRITHLQRPTAKMLPAADFLTGFPIAAGTVFPSRPMLPLVKIKTPAVHAAL
jgi:methionyl-tRNA formyltransferase